VVSFRTHLSAAGFGLAGVYAVVGFVELLLGDTRGALTFAIGAAVTGGLVAVLLPLLAPRGPGPDDEDDGPGGGGGGGDRPTPPWWPGFERDFWSYVDDPAPREPVPRSEDVTARR
jgi:hypothetical protein